MLPGGCTRGELTLQGQQQALDLGAWLRRRYIDELGLLPSAAPPSAVAGVHPLNSSDATFPCVSPAPPLLMLLLCICDSLIALSLQP